MRTDKHETKSYCWSYNQSLPVAAINNVTSSESFYMGFEGAEDFTKLGSSVTVSKRSIGSKTGLYSLQLQAGSPAVITIVPESGRNRYKFSYWIKTNAVSNMSVQVTRQSPHNYSQTTTIPYIYNSSWVLIDKMIEIPADQLVPVTITLSNASGNIYIDDLRIAPEDASVTSYTYKPLVGIWTASDVNNIPVTKYVYDLNNRLKVVRDHNDDIVQKTSYHYATSYRITYTSGTAADDTEYEAVRGSTLAWQDPQGVDVAYVVINGVVQTSFPYTAPDGTVWKLQNPPSGSTLTAENISGNATFSFGY